MDKDSASREQCQIYLDIAETQPIFCKDTNKLSVMPNLFGAACSSYYFCIKQRIL